MLPNDEIESDRLGLLEYSLPFNTHLTSELDMQHEIFTYTIGDRLGRAPPCDEDAKVGRVLDVGTGTGIWAIDFGELHPEAEVF